MNLYDYIKESLLDDMDTIVAKTDKLLKRDWFKDNATGNYKIKESKSGDLEIKGDVVIKGFMGEEFPGLNIDKFQGNLIIEKCPNLKSLDGLWSEWTYDNTIDQVKIYRFDGDLHINNCPKLTSLKCPKNVMGDFYLTGNTSLKSLDGAPKMVYNNVYIMKNGKKFTQEQINAVISCDYVFCSSEDNEADLCESQELYEALNNPYLLMLAKQLKETNKSFKNLLGYIGLAWDEVDSTNIKNYSWRFNKPSDKDIKAARAVISGKTTGFIITYKYDETGKMIFTYLINFEKRVANLTSEYHNKYHVGLESMRSTEIIDIVAGNNGRTDGMIIIYYASELATSDKKLARRKSREGMVMNTPEYYAKVARENIERYKKIIESNKAKGNSKQVEDLQNKVNKFLQDVMKASQNMVKNPVQYASKSVQLHILNDYVYDKTSWSKGNQYGKDGVLVLFGKYMEIWARATTGDSTFYGYEPDTRMKEIEAEIERLISVAQPYLKEFGI